MVVILKSSRIQLLWAVDIVRSKSTAKTGFESNFVVVLSLNFIFMLSNFNKLISLTFEGFLG